ncbi:ABCB10 [Symbiodinium sp. CCMP2592]|nr:ABCB10 [Symbiodinium sp. CCMP2592]
MALAEQAKQHWHCGSKASKTRHDPSIRLLPAMTSPRDRIGSIYLKIGDIINTLVEHAQGDLSRAEADAWMENWRKLKEGLDQLILIGVRNKGTREQILSPVLQKHAPLFVLMENEPVTCSETASESMDRATDILACVESRLFKPSSCAPAALCQQTLPAMDALTPSERERLSADGNVDLVRLVRGPQEVQRWSSALRVWKPPRKLLRVHLEHNDLNEIDVAQLLGAINGAVEAIYLHHNRLRSTRPLAAFFKKHANVLREVHLSHNELCTLASEALLLQVGSPIAENADDNTYLKACSWIRLEFNCIDVEKLIRRLPPSSAQRMQLADIGCTPTRCCCKSPRRAVPRIHSKFLSLQYSVMPDD